MLILSGLCWLGCQRCVSLYLAEDLHSKEMVEGELFDMLLRKSGRVTASAALDGTRLVVFSVLQCPKLMIEVTWLLQGDRVDGVK